MVDFGKIYYQIFYYDYDCDKPSDADIAEINDSLSLEQKKVILSYLKHNLGEDFKLFDAALGLTEREKHKEVPIEKLRAIAKKKLDFEALYAFFRVTPETAIENLSSSLNEVFEVHNATTGGTLDDARYMIWLVKCFFFHEDELESLLYQIHNTLSALLADIKQAQELLSTTKPHPSLLQPLEEFKDLQF